MELSKLRQYLLLKSKQLRLDLEAATLFKGDTEIGDVPENSVRRFLGSSLSARYSVGVGEVISAVKPALSQTNPKDVIIFDADFSPVFGWGETGSQLFPIESVYAIIEVKKTIDSAGLQKGVRQAVEARRLGGDDFSRPFTAVVAFASNIYTATLAKNINKLPIDERVDFVLILNPSVEKDGKGTVGEAAKSDYIAHWHYAVPGLGRGPIRFVSAFDAYSDAKKAGDKPHVFLTWGRSEDALMWFYLFLVSSINAMKNESPDLWKYTEASRTNLGYKGDSSGW